MNVLLRAFCSESAEHDLHARLLSSPLPGKKTWMAIGGEQITKSYHDAWEKGRAWELEELAGVVACCQNAHRQCEQAGYRDPIWAQLLASYPTGEQEIELHCSPTMNILLRPLGVDLLGYVPCHTHCEESLHLGTSLLALGREAGLIEEMDWLEEILAWPVEWTALHGIAEMKTGILKGAYHTDYTPTKRSVRYHGSRLSVDAARGLSFAYRKPRPARRGLAVQSIVKEQGGHHEKERRTIQ